MRSLVQQTSCFGAFGRDNNLLRLNVAPATQPNSVRADGFHRAPRTNGAVWQRLSQLGWNLLHSQAWDSGITLNHQDWFSNARTIQVKGQVQEKWVKAADPKDVAKLEIVEYLRKANGVKAALADFRIEDAQCQISFKGPGYSADAFIDRTNGTYELTETRQGLVAVLNDLHKGRDSGTAWAWIIDVSAGLMTLVSITGLVLIFFLQKRRASGLLAVAIGAVLCWVVYVVWVP